MDSWLYEVFAYADLIMGLIFLGLVAWLLPAKVRWLVLSFGLGILALQFWQRRSARERLAKLDQERQQLQQRLAQLDGEVVALREENQRLDARRQVLAQEQETIEINVAALAEGDEALEHTRELLAQRRQQLQQESIEAAAQQQRVSSALERWQAWRDEQERLSAMDDPLADTSFAASSSHL